MSETKEPKYKKLVEHVDSVSLGISIVVAILMGIGLGFLLKSWFEQSWLLWVGVFWGVAAAVLNVYKAYKKQVREFDEIAKKYDYNQTDKEEK